MREYDSMFYELAAHRQELVRCPVTGFEDVRGRLNSNFEIEIHCWSAAVLPSWTVAILPSWSTVVPLLFFHQLLFLGPSLFFHRLSSSWSSDADKDFEGTRSTSRQGKAKPRQDKARPGQGQGKALAQPLTFLDSGIDPGQSTLGLILGCFLLELRKRLNIYYKGRWLSPRGGMDNSDKEGPRARFGHHAKAKTHGPWSGHPESVGLDPEPRLSTLRAWTRPGTTRRSPPSLEKHEPRPLKRGRPSRGSWELLWSWRAMTKPRPVLVPNTWSMC
ncbi:hypothetical protein Sjap_003391 [Stephania japonica]|uniref:Uncharacterized protein n=1 Tax=Stephania japonica TaxID=461633 RepID=A0AAP0KNT7_9MAGN